MMNNHQPPRCFLAPESWGGAEAILAPEESHHLLCVLRGRPGAPVTVFDGQGRSAPARIMAVVRRQAQLRLDMAGAQSRPPPAAHIILAQALPKHSLMDGIIQKSVELGAAAVFPLLTERVVCRPGERHVTKTDRWCKIAREAARQCGADRIPEIRAPQPLSALSADIAACHRCFVGSLASDAAPMRLAVAGARPLPDQAALMLVIGPEGDLAPGELAALRGAGAIPVSFGAAVLRVETAALYGLSLLRYEFNSFIHPTGGRTLALSNAEVCG